MNNSGLLRRRLTPLEPLIKQIEGAKVLDAPAKTIGKQVRSLLSAQPLKDAVSGTWLGHAVHPMLTDVVIGSFTSATMLDLLGSDADGKAQKKLIGLGIAAYAPTALTGINDWADTEICDDAVRRAGLVHAAGNAVALTLYAVSLGARTRGRNKAGVFFGLLGSGVLMTGGYLGGHLTLNRGVGADQTVFDPGSSEWTVAVDPSQLAEGRPTRIVVDETPVLVVRSGELIFAIHDRCSHRGCSLSEGELEGEDIVCPCHGSRFSLRDGAVKQGPATSPQPAFQVRQQDGRVEVRRISEPVS